MLRRALGNAAGRERRESERRCGTHEQPQTQRQIGPERHHQHEAGEHRPGDAAHGVQGVGAPHVFPPAAAAGCHEVGQQRKGHPHPDRRNQHDAADHEAQRHQPLGCTPGLRLKHGDDVAGQQAEECEQERRARRRHPLRQGRVGGRLGGGGGAAGEHSDAKSDPQEEVEQH